jgi:hypothetical protein
VRRAREGARLRGGMRGMICGMVRGTCVAYARTYLTDILTGIRDGHVRQTYVTNAAGIAGGRPPLR